MKQLDRLTLAGFHTALLVLAACSGVGGGTTPVGPSGGSAGYFVQGGAGGGTGGGWSTDGGLFTDGAAGGLTGCASEAHEGKVVPLGLFVMQDRSGSMKEADTEGAASRWSQVTQALKDFVQLPGTDGISMGIGYFPIEPSRQAPKTCSIPEHCLPYSKTCFGGQCFENMAVDDSCWADDYAKPAVTIEELPGIAGYIVTSLDQVGTSGSTPMAPALWGAHDYVHTWAAAHPDHVSLVVLATDGYPSACEPGEIEDVAQIASGALANYGLKTFVIGIGENLENLNRVAAAGGTGQAIMVSTAGGGAEFLSALNAIRGTVSCLYKIPVPQDGVPDFNAMNFAFTPAGGTQEVFPRANDLAACGQDRAWYYDNPSNTQYLVLCPAACDYLSHSEGRVDIVLGCASIIK